ncbi:hypothetical protein [Candidatus Leptofilum sp.]|uniref:hypothetical protein n=1 Tax=Candidatus Leptofilum sp. TaxID=3241576 RepID=UPI003B5BB161
MSSYDLDQLLRLWSAEKLTNEQAIGQILLQIKALTKRIGDLDEEQEQARRAAKLTILCISADTFNAK